MVHVRVPATSANLGPGFDALGLALALYNEVEAREADGVTVQIEGEGAGRLATLLVNRDYRSTVVARLRLRPDAPPPQTFDVAARAWHPTATLAFLLEPGGTLLLCWDGERDCA